MNIKEIIETAHSEQTHKESAYFIALIQQYFPLEKQQTAIETFEYIIQLTYLRGQRDLLIEAVEKQKNSPFCAP
jgi:hypothetical protein